MRRGRIFIYLALIIILGLVGFAVVWQRYILPSQQQPTTEVVPTPVIDLVSVVVVSQHVPYGTPLDSSVLSVIEIPRETFIDGMFTNIAEVESRRAKFELESGIMLTRGMLIDSAQDIPSTGSVAALQIPPGMVAVSIPISRLSSVSYAPRPGDHVNVIATMMFVDLDQEFQTRLPNNNVGVIAPGTGTANLGAETGSSVGTDSDAARSEAIIETSSIVAVSGAGGGVIGRPFVDPNLGEGVTFYVVPSERTQRPRIVSQNLLQNAVVLYMGTFPTQEEEELELEQAGDGQAVDEPAVEPQNAETVPTPEPQKPDVVTLIVSPQDAITLNYLVYSGSQLTLALRSHQDDSRVQTESVTLQFLLNNYNISVPAKLQQGLEPRVDELVPPVLQGDLPEPTPQP